MADIELQEARTPGGVYKPPTGLLSADGVSLALEDDNWHPYGPDVVIPRERYEYCITMPIPEIKYKESKDEDDADKAMKREEKIAALRERQLDIVQRLREVGLQVKICQSRDKDEYFVLIRATQALLDKAAERFRPKYKLRPVIVQNPVDGVQHELRNIFMEFKIENRERFENGGEHNDADDIRMRMRGSVRRQQLILKMIESKAPLGANLDPDDLKGDKVINQVFPLHDEPCRKWLMENWAALGSGGRTGGERFKRFITAWQPLMDIRNYYGEKIAMYFTWLGFYTQWLSVPMIVSLAAGIYQMYLIYAPEPEGQPPRINYVTPFYCVFLAVWATLYLEYWKRKNAAVAHKWGVTDYSKRERPRPEFKGIRVFNPWSQEVELQHPSKWYLRIIAGLPIVSSLIAVVVAAAISLLLFRFIIKFAFASPAATEIYPVYLGLANSSMNCVNAACSSFIVDSNTLDNPVSARMEIISGLSQCGCFQNVSFVNFKREGACSGFCFLWEKGSTGIFSAIVMMTMNQLYKRIAMMLNKFENHRTDSEYENHLIAKVFIFQFINSYITLFWFAFYNDVSLCINNLNAFILKPCDLSAGSFVDCSVENGTLAITQAPVSDAAASSNLVRVPRPVAGSSCLQELSLQLTIIFIVKQAINNLVELGIPTLKRVAKTKSEEKALKKQREASGTLDDGHDKLSAVGAQAKLSDYNTFDDYNEIIVQFGYVTLFAAAFPLASFLAWLNNVFEIRVDSYKLTREEKRPEFQRTSGPGTWQNIMELMTIIAVLTNVLLLGITTDSLPQLLGIVPPEKNPSNPGAYTPELRFHELYLTLWSMVVLEHLIFLLKYIMAVVVPDVPAWVDSEQKGQVVWLEKKAQEENEKNEQRERKHSVVVARETLDEEFHSAPTEAEL